MGPLRPEDVRPFPFSKRPGLAHPEGALSPRPALAEVFMAELPGVDHTLDSSRNSPRGSALEDNDLSAGPRCEEPSKRSLRPLKDRGAQSKAAASSNASVADDEDGD